MTSDPLHKLLERRREEHLLKALGQRDQHLAAEHELAVVLGEHAEDLAVPRVDVGRDLVHERLGRADEDHEPALAAALQRLVLLEHALHGVVRDEGLAARGGRHHEAALAPVHGVQQVPLPLFEFF